MRNRRFVLVPLMVGMMGLILVSRNPRFETFHAVDVLQLLGSGMCFGAALVALLSGWRMRP